MYDFLINDKKEGSIKEIYIDGNLASKHILNNNSWLPICIVKDCTKFPDKNDLCKIHSREQKYLDEGTTIKKGDKFYTWNLGKWAIKCSFSSCTNHTYKNNYCKDHQLYKNTETNIGSTLDILNMASDFLNDSMTE